MNLLLGPTLSGKTTLMRIMAGLDVPATGRVLWEGKDVTGMRVQDRKVAITARAVSDPPMNFTRVVKAGSLALCSVHRLQDSRSGEVALRSELPARLHHPA